MFGLNPGQCNQCNDSLYLRKCLEYDNRMSQSSQLYCATSTSSTPNDVRISGQPSPHLKVLLNAFIGEVVGCKPHIRAVLNDPTACDMDTHSAACCPVHTKLQEKVNITVMSTAHGHM